VSDTEVNPDPDAPVPSPSAGDMLRTAREAAGMSVDTVAQQLKLAPRQVRAIEDGEFTQLPGRTFVRGFIRNYARLVRVDSEAVLGALPAGAAAPSLDSPALQPTAPTIGELPTTEDARPGWTRWAIPLTLVAIITATAFYEWTHPAADTRGSAARESPPSRERAVSKAQAPGIVGTPLPNPVAALPAPSSPAPVKGSTPPVVAPATSAPATVALKPPAESPPDAPPPSAPPSLVPSAATPSASAVAINSDAPLTLQFRDFSWTEVRDRNGRVLISRMNPGGTTQSIAGAPPFDVVIGNAADVALTWKGHSVDLAPHTRQNVARFTLE
jgi:cytoskeleton protein RodZ